MKTKFIPAIVMLIAGFIYCLVGIRYHLELLDFTRELLIVLVVFLFLGTVAKIIIDKNFPEMTEEEKDQEEETSQEGEEAPKEEEGGIPLENIEATEKE